MLGRIEHEAYLRRRRELIDDIVAGRLDIERQAPAPPHSREVVSLPETLQRSPLPVLVGACVIAAAVFWAFYATRDAVSTAHGERGAAIEARARNARSTPARLLVESFLAKRDWSEESLARFESTWNALSPNERAEARSAAWFRRFVDALREEINAHNALAEFDDTGASAAAGMRLVAFGELLGIGAELPEIHTRGATSRTDDAAPGNGLSPASGAEGAASAWLDAQDEDAFTLQLFALSGLEDARRLMDAYPELELALIDFRGEAPRYRVVYGAFPSEAAARSAHDRLPQGLVEHQPRAFVRTIRELRDARRRAAHANR